MNINWIDQSIIDGLNICCMQRDGLTRLAVDLADNALLNSAFLLAAFWWAWFRPSPSWASNHSRLLLTLISSVMTVLLVRLMILNLPFRSRPLFDPTSGQHPFLDIGMLQHIENISSFPSAHSALVMTLVTGFFFVSLRLGWIMLTYSIVFILLPSIYLGYHYTTDVMAGGIIGMLINALLQHDKLVSFIQNVVYPQLIRYPHPFYAGLFLLTYETCEHYIHLRNLVRLIIRLVT